MKKMEPQKKNSGMQPPADDDVSPYGYFVFSENEFGGRNYIFCVTPEQVRKNLVNNPGWSWERREDPMKSMQQGRL